MLCKRTKLFILFGLVFIFIVSLFVYFFLNNFSYFCMDNRQLDVLMSVRQNIYEDITIKTTELNGYTEKEMVWRLSEEIIKNIETETMENLNNIKIKEIEEEIYVGNKLSSKELNDVGSYTETDDEKYFRIFGEEGVNKRGRCDYYPGGELEALKDMVIFPIQIWSLDNNDSWYIRTINMQTHRNIAKTVKCIFSDLLQLDETDRLPIKTIGCYNYRTGSSTHTCGVAIDINYDENAEMTINGIITTGLFWKPYENIYSIRPNSAVVHIFEKYGFGWGGYWSSKKDYMHFSYFDR